MCGLSGKYELNVSGNWETSINQSLEAIAHRGPDDTGLFVEQFERFGSQLVLASTRLAILDLSSAGHMPMSTDDGSYTIAYNGEITNFIELRNELISLGRTFQSEGDTEVLLVAWQQWREKLFSKLEGMFAFAIFDKANNKVIFARDSFGIKPFFYSFSKDGDLAFSSEITGIIPLLGEQPKINLSVGFDFLRWGIYDSSHQTFIAGVNQLRPGHFMTFDIENNSLSEEIRYWWPSVSTTSGVTRSEAASTVRELFLESVDRNLRSDVPVGIALSGGVDSSAIACAVRYLHPEQEIQTFSYIAEGFEKSEEYWVDFVTESIGSKAFKVSPNSNDLLRDLDRMIIAQGEPFGSTSIYAQYRVFQLAKESGVVATLDGQGADELFGGYTGFPDLRLRSFIEKGQFGKAKRFLRKWEQWPGRSSNGLFKQSLLSIAATGFVRLLPQWAINGIKRVIGSPTLGTSIFDESFFQNYGDGPKTLGRESVGENRGNRLKEGMRSQMNESGLPSLLRHGDRNSMAFSIESRVPFLDVKLAEYCLSLPENYLVSDDGETKSILREALRGIVPDEILDRRDKVGFETPELSWLSEYANSSVLTSDLPNVAFLDRDKTKEFVAAGLKPDASIADVRFYWRLINLLRWVELLGVDAS